MGIDIIYDWLLVISFIIVAYNLLLFVKSVGKIILSLGIFVLILWLAAGRENIFKDKTLRKIIKYVSYAYIVIILLAIFPLFFKFSFILLLYTLISCIVGYISILIDIIILYYFYIKMKRFLQYLESKAQNINI